MVDDKLIKEIFSKTKDEYGESYDDKLFEQYRIYLGNIDNLENRRKITHSFFLSINTGLIAALGILAQFGTIESSNQLWVFGGGVAGILFAYSWFRTIRSYILLGTVKWDIILEIEKKLPLKIHEIEWELLTNKKKSRWSRYKKLTDVELAIPIIFIGLYILLILIITKSFDVLASAPKL